MCPFIIKNIKTYIGLSFNEGETFMWKHKQEQSPLDWQRLLLSGRLMTLAPELEPAPASPSR